MTRPIVWAGGLLLSAVVAGVTLGPRLRAMGLTPAAADAATRDATGGDTVVLQQDLRGHYTAHPEVDGRTLRMMVDTGASLCVFSEEDAAILGIRVAPSAFTGKASTANGTVAVAPIRLREVRIGGIRVRDVDAVVVPRGQLGTALLGMSFLRRLKGFGVEAGRLTLRG